jgi:hypothetical protein
MHEEFYEAGKIKGQLQAISAMNKSEVSINSFAMPRVFLQNNAGQFS